MGRVSNVFFSRLIMEHQTGLVDFLPNKIGAETGENIITWKKAIFRRNLNSIYRIIKALIGQE